MVSWDIFCFFLELLYSLHRRWTLLSLTFLYFCDYKIIKYFLTNRNEYYNLSTFMIFRDTNTIFRGNTLVSKCIDELMKLVGHHYLRSTLKSTLDVIFRERKPCEIDPTKLQPGESRESNLCNLKVCSLLYYFLGASFLVWCFVVTIDSDSWWEILMEGSERDWQFLSEVHSFLYDMKNFGYNTNLLIWTLDVCMQV